MFVLLGAGSFCMEGNSALLIHYSPVAACVWMILIHFVNVHVSLLTAVLIDLEN